MEPTFSLADLPRRIAEGQAIASVQSRQLSTAIGRHAQRIGNAQAERAQTFWKDFAELNARFSAPKSDGSLSEDALAYAENAARRAILMLDVLRERADNDAAHEAAGSPPVLSYESEIILDGRNLPRPVNYMLLKIIPPQGVATFDWKRPYLIIDPRAGHGAGIGGFKSDSQVGVALHDGHPVYFLVFRPHPERGQTLADVMRAEAAFVKEIGRRHPKSPKPIIVGNCQGGWATMVLAAANPDITGPLVDQRRAARLLVRAGSARTRCATTADCSAGSRRHCCCRTSATANSTAPISSPISSCSIPSRNLFGKYYDLFADIDGGRESFLEFERWWGGFHFMKEAEIRWIVEQLFIGNRLSRGEARHRARPTARPQGHPLADHRLRQLGRQHHAAAAGAELDRRHLRRRARDQDPRSAHHLHDPREGRPSRHFRLLVDREEGACRGHLDDENDRGARARPL